MTLRAALTNTGYAGKTGLYFFRQGLANEFFFAQKLGISKEREYMPAVIKASTSPNGVFGIAVFPFQTPVLLSKIAAHRSATQTSLRTALEAEFPNLKYIFLRRKNMLAQAVSYYRGTISDQDHPFFPKAQTLSLQPREFNYYGIERCHQLLEASNLYWERYFSSHKLEPLEISSEELAENFQETVNRVLEFLELPKTLAKRPVRMFETDALALEWEKRYRNLGGPSCSQTDLERILKQQLPAF